MNCVKLGQGYITPSKIVCVGRNYLAHIQELGNQIPCEMVLFNKSNSCISNCLRSSVNGHEIHYEAEITYVVKQNKLAGIGIGLDLTKRALQDHLKAKGLPWEKCKSFDASAVFSDFISLEQHPLPIPSFMMTLHINNQLAQKADFEHMIYKPDAILAEINQHMTLVDNDLIMTGTPEGVGQVLKGDEFIARLYSDEKLLIESTWIAQ